MSPTPDCSAAFARFRRDADEPLAARWIASDASFRELEFSSRGDRVTGRVWSDAGGRLPLALVVADEAARVSPVPGFVTATLDLPLLGTRRSPKWSERLATCLRVGPDAAADAALLEAFLEQAVCDLQALLDVCEALPGAAEPEAVGLVGLGAGALAGAVLRPLEPRVGFYSLVPGALAPALDPAAALAAEGSACALFGIGADGDRAQEWARLARRTPAHSLSARTLQALGEDVGPAAAEALAAGGSCG